jgi:ATP-dependent DNA helicase DinG
VEPALVLVDALGDLATALHGQTEDLDALSRRALGAAGEVDACLEPGLERVVWSEPDALAWAPVDVAEELRGRLWEDGPTAILVSATLTTGEDATFVRRRLGLDRAREAVVGSPYDFPGQALLYVPRAMPDPRADGFVERAAEEIVSLLALSEGRALVLTSSYRALAAYRDHVRGRVPYDVLVQGEAPRERLLERFRTEVGSVLLATSTFWQGVDVPGEALSLLVIDKLPFSAPGRAGGVLEPWDSYSPWGRAINAQTPRCPPNKAAPAAGSSTSGQRGSAARNARPYGRVRRRGSRIATTPRSVWPRMSRPNP